jgi:Family of unknown function (DUF5675)
MLIKVQRKEKTADGIFGVLTLDISAFTCVTMENLEKSIPEGTYEVNFTYSPHFNRTMPHLVVPDRDRLAGGDAGIRIHWANFPAQLEGCIAVGRRVNGDSIDQSLIPFNQLYTIISPITSGLQIEIKDVTV